MSYVDEILENMNQKQTNIKRNLGTTELFPIQAVPYKALDRTAELVLKFTFQIKVAFLEEFTFLFAFSLSKSSFESLIIDLEQKGFLQSKVSKEYGKYWVLTKTALYCLYTDKTASSPKPFAEIQAWSLR